MSERRIVNVASYKRTDSLVKTLESLIDQCDEINVILNDFEDEIPSILYNNKINLYFSDNSKGDAFKFYKLMDANGYFLTVDDDLIYPPNYVQFMIAKCKEYGNTKVITLHGRNFSIFPILSYYRGASERYSCLQKVNKNTKVQFGGTGVMCFHTDLFKLPISYFQYANMADIWIGKHCYENNIEILCVRHESGYIGYIPQRTTIYDVESRNDTLQTLVANSTFDKTVQIHTVGEVEKINTPEEVFIPKEDRIKIVSTIERKEKTIDYSKVNQIFHGASHQSTIKQTPKTIQNKMNNNTSILNKLSQKRNRR
jgi:hypothetical protein